MKRSQRYFLSSLVVANAVALAFLFTPVTAIAVSGDGDFCDESEVSGCVCVVGEPFIPDGCYEDDENESGYLCTDGSECAE